MFNTATALNTIYSWHISSQLTLAAYVFCLAIQVFSCFKTYHGVSHAKWLNFGVCPIPDVDPHHYYTLLNIKRQGILPLFSSVWSIIFPSCVSLKCMPSQHTLINFYGAMRCISAVFAVMQCPSVRLSRSWITSKRINISSKFFHDRVATPF